ncbi:protein of unknown function (plasmid) [Streptantibioticus cattleyicolor NRRL 8057 = DSM 46488]|nr:protein of unknown function [Streptantibioticus cattleyicolor NRRL 8057 = DSM 46488]
MVQVKTPTNRWEMQVQALPGAPSRKAPSSPRRGRLCRVAAARCRVTRAPKGKGEENPLLATLNI